MIFNNKTFSGYVINNTTTCNMVSGYTSSIITPLLLDVCSNFYNEINQLILLIHGTYGTLCTKAVMFVVYVLHVFGDNLLRLSTCIFLQCYCVLAKSFMLGGGTMWIIVPVQWLIAVLECTFL